MFQGFIATLFLGILWGVVGVIVSQVARKKQSIVLFYAYAVLLNAVISWLFLVNWQALLDGKVTRLSEMLLWIGLAGFFNGLCQWLIVSAMSKGHMGMVWAISQSALLIFYINSSLIWREAVTVTGLSGIALLITGIFVLAMKSQTVTEDHTTGYQWLWLALAAFFLLGFNQTILSIPSHWPDGQQDSASLRLPVFFTTNCLFHFSIVFLKKLKVKRDTLKLSALFSVVSVISFFLMFHCLDVLAKYGLSRMVFPVGVGTCISLFTLYSMTSLKEKFNRYSVTGVLLICGGVIMLAIQAI